MYIDIENEEERRGGKIEMWLSAPLSKEIAVEVPNPLEEGACVHLIFTRLIREDRLVQTLNSAIFTLNLRQRLYDDSFQVIRYKAKNYGDVEKNIRKILPDAVCLPSMSIECWDAANAALCRIRRRRIKQIMSMYASEQIRVYSLEEFVGTALEAISLKVNELLNGFVCGKVPIFPGL